MRRSFDIIVKRVVRNKQPMLLYLPIFNSYCFVQIKLRCSLHLVSKYPEKNKGLDPYWFVNLEDPVWEHEREE